MSPFNPLPWSTMRVSFTVVIATMLLPAALAAQARTRPNPTVQLPAPAPPGALIGALQISNSGPTSLLLRWTSIPGAGSYAVVRSTTPHGPWSPVGTIPDVQLNDPGLLPGTAYYYQVVPIAMAHRSAPGLPSAPPGATAPFPVMSGFGGTIRGPAPQLLSAACDPHDTCTWSWEPVPGAVAYRIYRRYTNKTPLGTCITTVVKLGEVTAAQMSAYVQTGGTLCRLTVSFVAVFRAVNAQGTVVAEPEGTAAIWSP